METRGEAAQRRCETHCRSSRRADVRDRRRPPEVRTNPARPGEPGRKRGRRLEAAREDVSRGRTKRTPGERGVVGAGAAGWQDPSAEPLATLPPPRAQHPALSGDVSRSRDGWRECAPQRGGIRETAHTVPGRQCGRRDAGCGEGLGLRVHGRQGCPAKGQPSIGPRRAGVSVVAVATALVPGEATVQTRVPPPPLGPQLCCSGLAGAWCLLVPRVSVNPRFGNRAASVAPEAAVTNARDGASASGFLLPHRPEPRSPRSTSGHSCFSGTSVNRVVAVLPRVLMLLCPCLSVS